jgi:hypothetical protein
MGVHIQGVPFNQVLTFPVHDAQSIRRFLVAAGLSLGGLIIPVVPGLFVAGYSIRILRGAVRDGEVSMPAWEGWNRLLADGASAALIALAYLLPGILAFAIGLGGYFLSFLAIIPALDRSDSLSVFVVMLPAAILCIGVTAGALLLLAGAIPLPAAAARFADEGRIGAAFQLAEIGGSLRRNPVGYLGAWVVLFGLMYFAYFLYMAAYFTVILCCPGYLLTLVTGMAGGLIWTAMIGLAYRQGKPSTAG